jgi:hypothetical protein
VHAADVMHDTPSNWLLVAPDGVGKISMVQEVPFQRSTNGTVTFVPLTNEPTAVQEAAELQDTALSWLLGAPLGLGAIWMVQVEPSLTSTRGPESVVPEKAPTATQAVADGHDTPASSAVDVAGTGVLCWNQSADAGCAMANTRIIASAAAIVKRLISSHSLSREPIGASGELMNLQSMYPDGTGPFPRGRAIPGRCDTGLSWAWTRREPRDPPQRGGIS